MKVEQRVLALVAEKIADRPDLFLVEAKMHTNGKLMILIDGDKGVAVQDCVAISRHVGFHLEEENLVDTAYTLEVSSPGVDFPLTMLRQYAKNVGRNLSVKFKDGNKTEGKLAEVKEGHILLQELKKEKGKKAQTVDRLIPLNEIIESKVLISFK
ncbi:MAG: ribosome assembly cofactor RimP [Sphingobacteriaceae bacterium]|nr:ribosome assembly cofactor RimP [Sphingobacteriaceae bacterium]